MREPIVEEMRALSAAGEVCVRLLLHYDVLILLGRMELSEQVCIRYLVIGVHVDGQVGDLDPLGLLQLLVGLLISLFRFHNYSGSIILFN